MNDIISVTAYSSKLQPGIRRILEKIGWDEQYIIAAQRNAIIFSKDTQSCAINFAVADSALIGFIYTQLHHWNRLSQLQGLAVDPGYQRQGIAKMLVEHAENFAQGKNVRGIYVDTPSPNHGGHKFYEALGYLCAYEMPGYYEDGPDGVTYQNFF